MTLRGARYSVLFEDDWLLAIDKPPGLVVHPSPGTIGKTAVDLVADRIPGMLRPEGGRGAGFVHRLDRDTSGVLLAAKDGETFAALARMNTARKLDKRYLALVQGRFHDSEGEIDRPLGPDPRDRRRMAARPEGKASVTRWKRLEELPRSTLVEVELVTGRTHQIRVHFSAIGHSVVGDVQYGVRFASARGLDAARVSLASFPRQALHAARLSLDHPKTGERLTIEAPLPSDMALLLERLRRLASSAR